MYGEVIPYLQAAIYYLFVIQTLEDFSKEWTRHCGAKGETR